MKLPRPPNYSPENLTTMYEILSYIHEENYKISRKGKKQSDEASEDHKYVEDKTTKICIN